MLIADADANRVTGFVEHRHAAVAIGAHGDMGKRNTGIESCFCGFARFHGIFGARMARVDAGSDVHVATLFRPFNAFSKEVFIAVDMRRQELCLRDLAIFCDLEEVFHAVAAIAHMHIDDAGFAADHAADARLGSETAVILCRWLTGTMIAHGNLASTDDLVDHDDILADTACDGRCWQLVSTRVNIGGQALVFQTTRFGEQALDVACRTIGTEQAADGRDAGGRYFRK